MKKYKEHFVAFLDIMGFKSLLLHSSCDDIYPIFDVLHTKSQAKLNLNGVQIKAYDHIYHTILSDSIIVYIEADIEDAFAALIDVCGRLQNSLANRDEPILLRGGISKGDLFYENDIIYGKGLTDAYLLESKLAKYPRIIFSGDTLALGISNAKYMFTELEGITKSYSQDDDYLYFINYLETRQMKPNDIIPYYDRLKGVCKKYLYQEIDHSLREKYIWVQKEIEKSIERNLNVKEHYKKLKEEENERKFTEYNNRFSIYPTQIKVQLKVSEDESNV